MFYIYIFFFIFLYFYIFTYLYLSNIKCFLLISLLKYCLYIYYLLIFLQKTGNRSMQHVAGVKQEVALLFRLRFIFTKNKIIK